MIFPLNEELPYTNRELDMKFKILGEKLDENHKETFNQVNLLDKKLADSNLEQKNFLVEIKQLATKTNGRVNALEIEAAKRKTRNATLFWTITIITTVTLPLLVYIWFNTLQTISERFDRQGQAIIRLQSK